MSAVAFFAVSATDVAVTVAVPADTPLTAPLLETVATFVFDDDHDTAVDPVPCALAVSGNV